MGELKRYAYLAYLGPLWVAGLFADKSKDMQLRYHINQGMMLFLFECISVAVYIFIRHIPYVGGLIASVFGFIFFPVCALYITVGVLNVMRTRMHPLPYIGLIKIIRN